MNTLGIGAGSRSASRRRIGSFANALSCIPTKMYPSAEPQLETIRVSIPYLRDARCRPLLTQFAKPKMTAFHQTCRPLPTQSGHWADVPHQRMCPADELTSCDGGANTKRSNRNSRWPTIRRSTGPHRGRFRILTAADFVDLWILDRQNGAVLEPGAPLPVLVSTRRAVADLPRSCRLRRRSPIHRRRGAVEARHQWHRAGSEFSFWCDVPIEMAWIRLGSWVKVER